MRLKKDVLDKCHIYTMLKKQKRHISFHTPGHKIGKWDITELSFSDNLAEPEGVLLRAARDIAARTGAYYSFILTDGSTCGVFAMIRASGAKRILIPRDSHKSVYNAAKLLGVSLKILDGRVIGGIPRPPTLAQIARDIEGCDAVLVTYPDYYGNLTDLQGLKELCRSRGALLLVDGAHGSMFKGTPLYAGRYADLWVDGVHKNLPALTQGATVSCGEKKWFQPLKEAVGLFRTTSPNYLIMASVEYAVKYPRNEKIERQAEALKRRFGAYPNGDWSKAVFSFGENAERARLYFEKKGGYPEFCDGANILFYFSPATKAGELKKLSRLLRRCKPLLSKGTPTERRRAPHGKKSEWISLKEAAGRVSADNCGLFPPCIPLVADGEVVTPAARDRLLAADGVYGLSSEGTGDKADRKIKVYQR